MITEQEKKVRLREIINEIAIIGQGISLNQQQKYESRLLKLFDIPVVSGWLELYGNEELFNEMAKKNCPCRYDDGTQRRYNDNQPLAMLTHFKLV